MRDPSAALGKANREPTLSQFVRHAELFGSELVVETAADDLTSSGLVVLETELALLARRNGKRNGKPAATRQRRTTPDLQRQVTALRALGMVPAAIADTLNISDRRCRELIRAER
jgi:hypothetical protein